MRQQTLYRLMGLALGGMALGIALGVSDVDPASHWVFSASLLAFLALGVVWALRAWAGPENRPLLRLMALAVAGIVGGWIVGAAGAKTLAEIVFAVSMLALVALLIAFATTRRRATRPNR